MAKKKKEKLGQKEIEDKFPELNAKLDKKVNRGMAKTRAWKQLWQSGLRYFFSQQLEGKKQYKNWDWITINYIWPSAMQEIAKLSKNYPKIITHPWESSDTDAAETWQSKLQWDWQKGINKRGMRLEQIAAIMDGKLFGYRVSKIFWDDMAGGWDDKKKEWVGEVKHRLWHPANFWASDDEKIDDGDCGTVRYVSLDYAQQKWPKFKDELALEAEQFVDDRQTGESPSRGSYSATGSTAAIAAGSFSGDPENAAKYIPDNELVSLVVSGDKTAGEGRPKDEKIVKIEEIYFKDYSTTPVVIKEDIPKEELLQLGQVKQIDGIYYDNEDKPITVDKWPKRVAKEYEEPLYPNGRFVVRCGKTILNPNEEDQKYPYSRWPFVVVPHYLLPHMWQGANAVELYKSMQDMINISASFLFNNMKLFGAPKVAVENDAIALRPNSTKQYKIATYAGAIIRLARGALSGKRFQIIPPASPGPGVSMLYQLFAQEFKNLTGLQGVARGEQLKGRTTAKEASILAISSHDRIALQSVYEDEWIRQIMILDAEISQANYSLERFIRIVGEDNLVGVAQITQKLKDVRFDVDIIPGTTLPFDEEKRIAKYLQAYNLLSNPNPHPFIEDVLRILEIPNWKKVISKHQIWQRWVQFLQLYEAVESGQIQPANAVKVLAQEAMKTFAERNATRMALQGGENAS